MKDLKCLICVATLFGASLSAGAHTTDAPTQQPVPQTPALATPSAATKPLAFDVISIRPDKDDSVISQTVNGEAIEYSHMMIRDTPDGFTAENVTAESVISMAYGIKQDLISGGPDWLDSASYDIQAKVTSFDPPDSHQISKAERNQMLQSMLADRFHLVTHYAAKEAPIYELTIAKDGPRLHEAKPGDAYPNGIKGADGVSVPGVGAMGGPGYFTFQAISTASLVGQLSHEVHRLVVDKTGLTGRYDIILKWTPDNTPADSPDASGPTIFAAVQEQLGLKLESAKGPVKSLVIDHIEKPSEN